MVTYQLYKSVTLHYGHVAVLLDKLITQKLPQFMIPAFKTVGHLSLNWAEPDESSSRSTISSLHRTFVWLLLFSQRKPCMHISFSPVLATHTKTQIFRSP